jgi:membrane protein DedA with SNARE-associated domain
MENSLVAWQGLAIFGMFFVAGLGFPMPTSVTLAIWGSLARAQQIDWLSWALIGWAGIILGDLSSFALAWRGAYIVQPWIKRLVTVRIYQMGEQYGFWGVLLTRFLLTPLGGTFNLWAGVTRFSLHQFTWAVVLGELLWVILYMGLGFAFSQDPKDIADIAGQILSTLTAVCVTVIGLGLLGHWLTQRATRASKN